MHWYDTTIFLSDTFLIQVLNPFSADIFCKNFFTRSEPGPFFCSTIIKWKEGIENRPHEILGVGNKAEEAQIVCGGPIILWFL